MVKRIARYAVCLLLLIVVAITLLVKIPELLGGTTTQVGLALVLLISGIFLLIPTVVWFVKETKEILKQITQK